MSRGWAARGWPGSPWPGPASGRDRFGRSERFDPLLHFDERVHRRRTPADQPDAFLTAHPRRLEFFCVFDVVSVTSLHAREVHQLPGVRGVLPTDDDDRLHLLGELARRDLALH